MPNIDALEIMLTGVVITAIVFIIIVVLYWTREA